MRRVAAVLAVLVVAGCSGPSLPPPLTSTGAPAPGGSGPAASPGEVPGSGGPAASGASSEPGPAGFSAVQAELFAALREDARVNCAPRTTDLPQNATDAIECTVGSDLVERVGVYRFDTPEAARAAYIARLAGYGVALRSGDCQRGTAGDRAWAQGDDPGEAGDLPYRIGCFLDENGTANVRIICGPPDAPGPVRYIGVLGAGTDLLALTGWAERHPDSPEQPIRIAPGLCGNLATGPD